MKSRWLDAIGDALALVKKSNVAEATALLRGALSGGAVRDFDREPNDVRAPYPGAAARRPLGEALQALRAARVLQPKAPPAPEEKPRYPDDENFTSRVYRGAAGSLNYKLYVPSDLARDRAAVVLMLHGCTQDPDDFAIGTRMNRLADEFGFIVAYPHQPHSANASGCWNWFDRRHQHRGSGEPARLAGLAQSLAHEFGLGRERTFAAGLSAGGAMADVLAATYPDVFEAIGVHSGLPYGAAGDVPSAFAAMRGGGRARPAPRISSDFECRKIVFHGGADSTVHPANSERILEQTRLRATPLQQVDHEWEIAGRLVTRRILQDSAGRSIHEHWLVEGGQHAWFGGDSRGSYTATVGVDASREMAAFFLKR